MKYTLFLFLIIFIGLIFWLSTLNIDIVINVLNYTILTSLDKALTLFLCIYIPFYLVKSITSRLVKKIQSDAYITRANRLLEITNYQLNIDIASDILKISKQKKLTKQVIELINLVNNKKYDQALITTNKIKANYYNKTILLQYLYVLYKEKKDIKTAILYAKKGINLRKKPLWFLQELFDLCYDNKMLDSEIVYLYKSLKEIKNKKGPDYDKYDCLISYFYIIYLNNNKEQAKAVNTAKNLIKVHNNFVPTYTFLIEFHEQQKQKKKVYELLVTLWKYNKSYDVIKLWQKFYDKTEDNNIKEDIDINKEPLLMATIYIKNNKLLEAQNLLQSIAKNNSTEKNMLELDIMIKENNFKNINNVIQNIISTNTNNNFWYDYIV